MTLLCSILFASASALSGVAEYSAVEKQVSRAVNEIDCGQRAVSGRCSLGEYFASVVRINGTNVWTKALQQAINEHEVVVIPAAPTPYWIDATVTIPSHRRIEAAGATVALLPGVRVLMLRNEHAPDGTLMPIGPDVRRDEDIAIVGGHWEDWTRTRMGYGKTGRFDPDVREIGRHWGVSTLFYFGNCDRVTVRDVVFAHAGAFAVQSGNGDAHVYENIRFNDCYADGLHLNGNLSRVLVRNVRGTVGDDLVALNAYDWLNSSVNFGPQQYILCEDLELKLKGGRGYPAIRLQPAKFRYSNGMKVDCRISDVVFRRVKGITTFKMYLQTPPYFIGKEPEWAEVGTGGNIFFEDIDIDLVGPIDRIGQYETSDPVRGHFGAFEFGADLSLVVLRNISIRFHLDRWPLSHLAMVGPKSCIKSSDGREVFDPYVNCHVQTISVAGLKVHGDCPSEIVRTTVFDDVNRDGRSSGRGRVDSINVCGTEVIGKYCNRKENK